MPPASDRGAQGGLRKTHTGSFLLGGRGGRQPEEAPLAPPRARGCIPAALALRRSVFGPGTGRVATTAGGRGERGRPFHCSFRSSGRGALFCGFPSAARLPAAYPRHEPARPGDSYSEGRAAAPLSCLVMVTYTPPPCFPARLASLPFPPAVAAVAAACAMEGRGGRSAQLDGGGRRGRGGGKRRPEGAALEK